MPRRSFSWTFDCTLCGQSLSPIAYTLIWHRRETHGLDVLKSGMTQQALKQALPKVTHQSHPQFVWIHTC